MNDKINLYINSAYRKKDETTSNLKIIIPSGLIKSYGKLFLNVLKYYLFNYNIILRNKILFVYRIIS